MNQTQYRNEQNLHSFIMMEGLSSVEALAASYESAMATL